MSDSEEETHKEEEERIPNNFIDTPFSDLTFVSNDGEEFKVVRYVITKTTNSSFLLTLCESSKQNEKIELKFSGQEIAAFLDTCHNCDTEINDKMFENHFPNFQTSLLKMYHKYDMSDYIKKNRASRETYK